MQTLTYEQIEELLKKAVHLRQCPHCRGDTEIVVRIPLFGNTGALVRCRNCGIATPFQNICEHAFEDGTGRLATPVIPEKILEGIMSAVQIWNGIEGK